VVEWSRKLSIWLRDLQCSVLKCVGSTPGEGGRRVCRRVRVDCIGGVSLIVAASALSTQH
jgi:hypothetical protein